MALSLGNIDSCFSVHHLPGSLDSTERSVTVAPRVAAAERNKRASLYYAVLLSMSNRYVLMSSPQLLLLLNFLGIVRIT